MILCVRMYSVTSVLSASLWPWGLCSTRPLCPWNSPGKNTGVGYHALLQRIFPTQGLNLHHLCLSHCRWILYPLTHLGSPLLCISVVYSISLLGSIHCTEGLQFGGHLDFWEPRGSMRLSWSLSVLPSSRLQSITAFKWICLPYLTLTILVIMFNFLEHLHVTGSVLSASVLSSHHYNSPRGIQYLHIHWQRWNQDLQRPSFLFKVTRLERSKIKIKIHLYLTSLLHTHNTACLVNSRLSLNVQRWFSLGLTGLISL